MVSDFLTSVGYETMSVYDGLSVLPSIRTHRPDFVILDLMLPGLDGIEVARLIRRESAVPILMLTARASEGDKLLGLEVGADDYVTKPFSVRELGARVRAIQRRAAMIPERGVQTLRSGPFEIDAGKRTLTKNGRPIDLTPAQFEFLLTLMREQGRVFSRHELIETVSGYDYEGYERTVDTHIKNIRRAIEDDAANPRYLITVWGVGYKFEAVE